MVSSFSVESLCALQSFKEVSDLDSESNFISFVNSSVFVSQFTVVDFSAVFSFAFPFSGDDAVHSLIADFFFVAFCLFNTFFGLSDLLFDWIDADGFSLSTVFWISLFDLSSFVYMLDFIHNTLCGLDFWLTKWEIERRERMVTN